MHQSELVEIVAHEADVTKRDTKKIMDTMLGCIMDIVADGESITLMGFGTFLNKHFDEKRSRNPRTGEKVMIPARNVPHFRFGNIFKRTVIERNVGKEVNK